MKRLTNTIIILTACFIGFGSVIFADTVENRYEPYPLIFVHGFNNTPETTDYTDLWKEPYHEFEKFFMVGNESKYFSGKLSTFQKFDYRIKSNGDIDGVADDLKDFIDTAVDTLLPGRPEKDKKVIIVTHSMGGLVTRRLLEKYPTYKDKVERVVFVGTPHLGSPLASGIILIDRMIPELYKAIHNEHKVSTPDMSPIPNKAYQDRVNKLEDTLYWFNEVVNWNHGIRIKDVLAGYNSPYNPWAPHMQGQGVAVGEMVVPADAEASKTFVGEALKWDYSQQIYVTSQTESLPLKSSYARNDTFLAQKPLAMPNDFKIIQGSGDSAGSRALGKAAKISLKLLATYSGLPASNTLDDLENGDGVVSCASQTDPAYQVTPTADIYTVARCHLTETKEWQPILDAIDDSPIIENMYVAKWPATPAQIVVKVKDYLLADIEIASITVDGNQVDLTTVLSDFNDGSGHYKPYVKFDKVFLTERQDPGVLDKSGNPITLYSGEFYVTLDLDTNSSHVVEIEIKNPSTNLPAVKTLVIAPVQLVGSWEVDVPTGNWSGFSYEESEACRILTCGVEYSGGYWWYTGPVPMSDYYTHQSSMPPSRTGEEVAYLYKLELPPNNAIDYIDITLARATVKKYIIYYAGIPYESEPASYPPDILAIAKIDYSFNSPVGHPTPIGEQNLHYEEIGGHLENIYERELRIPEFEGHPAKYSVTKGIKTSLLTDSITKRIPINNTIETVWISVYPANIQGMKAQVEPYAMDALTDPLIWEYSWDISIGARYSIEDIHFHKEGE